MVMSTTAVNERRVREVEAMTDTCVVLGSTNSAQPGGRLSKVFDQELATYPCRLGSIKGAETTEAGRASTDVAFMVVFPYDAVVPEEARLRITTELGEVLNLDVVTVLPGSRNVSLRVTTEKVP